MPDTTAIPGWIHEFGADVTAVFLSVVIVMVYYIALRIRVRRNPAYSVHYVNELVMKQIKKLLVQWVIGVERHTWLTRAEICYSIRSMLENIQLPCTFSRQLDSELFLSALKSSINAIQLPVHV